MYSGRVAAAAFVRVEAARELVSRVVLIGPSHHVPFAGLAVPSSTAFETPLGAVAIDETARRQILGFPFVEVLDDAHHWEHSLEVQLPFLQEVLAAFAVLPIAVGRASPAQVDEVLEALWGGDETLIVVSSDLSHYFDYDTARRMDAATASAIESLGTRTDRFGGRLWAHRGPGSVESRAAARAPGAHLGSTQLGRHRRRPRGGRRLRRVGAHGRQERLAVALDPCRSHPMNACECLDRGRFVSGDFKKRTVVADDVRRNTFGSSEIEPSRAQALEE